MRRTAALLALAGGLLAVPARAQTALPGTVQAETYSSMSGVVIEPTTDTGGGDVGYIDAGDWMAYAVNPASSGWYTVSYRIATTGTTGQVVLSLPNTGGWQDWTTVGATVNLAAGQQDLTIFSKVGGWNMNWWQLTKQ